LAVVSLCVDGDLPSKRAELHRVIEEARQDLLHPTPVEHGFTGPGRPADDSMSVGFRLLHLHDSTHQLDQIRVAAVEVEASGFDTREIQQLTYEDRQLTGDRKSTRLNSSHRTISYAVFCLKKKNKKNNNDN